MRVSCYSGCSVEVSFFQCESSFRLSSWAHNWAQLVILPHRFRAGLGDLPLARHDGGPEGGEGARVGAAVGREYLRLVHDERTARERGQVGWDKRGSKWEKRGRSNMLRTWRTTTICTLNTTHTRAPVHTTAWFTHLFFLCFLPLPIEMVDAGRPLNKIDHLHETFVPRACSCLIACRPVDW